MRAHFKLLEKQCLWLVNILEKQCLRLVNILEKQLSLGKLIKQ